MYVKSFFLCLSFVATLSSSIGSNSESLLVCSKFHFEEKVLEKLVRLEHKMELTDEKLKKWEDSFSSKLDKMDSAIRQTKEFVESIRIYHAQEQVRINDSYQEIVERFHIQSNNATNFNREQIKTSLDYVSLRMQEFSVAEKNRQKALELMKYTLNQEQQRFNESFDLIFENFKLASNETINELVATKQKDFQETLKYSLSQQKTIIDDLSKHFRTNITKLQQQIVDNSARVAMTACTGSSKSLSSNVVLEFNDIKTNSGITNLSYFKSSGKFTIETEGLYLLSSWIFSYTNAAIYAVYRNGNAIAFAYVHNDSDFTRSNGGSATAVVAIDLKAGDVVWVQSARKMFILDYYSCLTIVKLK